jgi:CRISPR-associated protein Csb2
VSPTPLAATHGVLLADEVHRQVARKLNGISTFLLGTGGAATNHEHAHWVPISNGSDPTVHGLVVWAPRGITTDEVARIITVRRASGRRWQRGGEQAYQLKGLPDVELRLQAVGTIHQVAPELCGPARRWSSLTPYLPVRHRKRESLDDHLATDVARELTYRGQPASVTVTRINPDETELDRWAQRFRRYRTTERLTKARPGFRLRLQFTDDVHGPLLLGHLSHFGFGIFIPENPA